MDGEKSPQVWRPLSSGSKNDRIASLYKQRNPREDEGLLSCLDYYLN